jgi:hypothetical protein
MQALCKAPGRGSQHHCTDADQEADAVKCDERATHTLIEGQNEAR